MKDKSLQKNTVPCSEGLLYARWSADLCRFIGFGYMVCKTKMVVYALPMALESVLASRPFGTPFHLNRKSEER